MFSISLHIRKQLVPLVLNVLKEDMNKSYIEYEYVNDQSENMQDVLNVQLNRLDAREKRIKEAYLAGVDSLDEYKKNKADIEKERELLYQQSNNQEEYKKNIDMPGKIRGVYDILNSDEYSKDENIMRLHQS